MGNKINKVIIQRCWPKGTILAYCLVIILSIGNSFGFMEESSILYSSEGEVHWTSSFVIISSPLQNVDSQMLIYQTSKFSPESQATVGYTNSPSVEFEHRNTYMLKSWENSLSRAKVNDQYHTLKSSFPSASYSISPSSSYLDTYQTKDLYMALKEQVATSFFNASVSNSSSELVEDRISSTSHLNSQQVRLPSKSLDSINFLPTSATRQERLVHLSTSITPNYNTVQTVQLDDVLTYQSIVVVDPTPPNWKVADTSTTAVAHEAMTWVTSQPSSAEHLQSEYHLPAGTVAGIVVASVGFLGIVAAALGFLALKKFRSLHTKTYDSSYVGDSFSYLDNLQVSYINHHVELPKETIDEMFSLDNDSFLNSLEAMTMENYWAEESKSTKV